MHFIEPSPLGVAEDKAGLRCARYPQLAFVNFFVAGCAERDQIVGVCRAVLAMPGDVMEV